MMVGRERLAKDREMRIAIADIQVTEHLVVGAVLLDDENDVLHSLAEFGHAGLGSRAFRATRQTYVLRDLQSGRSERTLGGQRKLEKARLLQLIDILVRCAAGFGLAAIDGQLGWAALQVRAGRAFAVDDEDAAS